MIPVEKVTTLLRDTTDAHAALERVIAGLDLQPPTHYHSTLVSLASKRGVLQAIANQFARQEPVKPLEANLVGAS